MWKVIANFDDPTSFIQLQNFVQIFNPRVSPFKSRGTLTVKQWFNALKVFYSRSNITDNTEYFSRFRRNSRRHMEQTTATLVATLPEEYLWLLHFITIHRIESDGTLTLINTAFSDIYNSDTTQVYYHPSTERSYRTTKPFFDPGFEECITKIFKDYADTIIHEHFSHRIDYRIHPDIGHGSYYNSYAAYIYDNHLKDYPHILHNDPYRNLTPTDFLTLTNNSDAVQLVMTGNHEQFNLTARIPVTKDNKTPLFHQMNYSASPTSLLPWPLKSPKEHDPICYGVELELATDYSVQELVEATDEPFFIVKQDSSVTGNKRHKNELATVPMSYKMHKKQWAHWFSNLDYSKFDTTHETSNGMHVHIGKDSFTDEQHRKNFVWFFTQPAHLEFMQLISHRDKNSWQLYSPIPENRASTRVTAYQSQQDNMKRARGCVHFSNKGTIEVRLFRGIVSLADIIKNLEFVDSIFHFTMQGQTFTQLSLKAYLKWLHKQPRNQYAIIKKYLDRTPKLLALINTSDLLNLIFNEKSPEKILELIQKNNYPITNEHITILNKRWRKRIFILDKTTGRIKLDDSRNASLSFLDRILEQKILRGSKKAAA